MASILSADTMEFGAYLRQTEPAMKVRPASMFLEDLQTEFAPVDESNRAPSMISTKLGRDLQFRPGEVTGYIGYSGHRKSFFTGQVGVDLCRQGQRVLLASLEMAPARSLARMARQCYAVSRPSPAALDEFSSWTDDRMWIFDHVGRLAPALCLAVLRYFAEVHRGGHVVIDSMMMIVNSEEHLDEQKQFITDLVRCAQETGLHLHLVAHCRKPQNGEGTPPTKYDLRGSAAITDQVHNVVSVWANKPKATKLQENPLDSAALAEPDALVSVEKQRNAEFEGRVKLWFDPASLRFVNTRTEPVTPYSLAAALPASP